MSLKVENLVKKFEQGSEQLTILNGVDLELKDGEVIAIVGYSGSGKTTLLSILAGLEKPTAGSVSLAGAEYLKFDDKKLTQFRAQNISMVFQQYYLIPYLTALENVSLPMEIAGEEHAVAKAKVILEKMKLQDRMTHFPTSLSGGESQRVGIARALAMEPKLLLADEPSGNLDPETGESVMNFFFEQVRRQKTSAILVTHNLELTKNCDRVLRLHQGKLV